MCVGVGVNVRVGGDHEPFALVCSVRSPVI